MGQRGRRWAPSIWERAGLQTALVRSALVLLGVAPEVFEAAYLEARHAVFKRRGVEIARRLNRGREQRAS